MGIKGMGLLGQSVKISYVKVNLKCEIIACNQNFINFFALEKEASLLGRPIMELIPGVKQKLYLKVLNLCENEQKSVLIFKNHRLAGVEEPLVAIIYAMVSRKSDVIVIHIANWLNWIWRINSALNSSYNIIAGMGEFRYRKKIKQLVEMYWFKALSPLLMHIPNGVISMINSWACFDILKIFNNKRGENIFSKDYNRDMISRIRHNIKRERKLKGQVDINDILKDDRLINLKYKDELFIPHTILEDDIIVVAANDVLLEGVLDMYRDHTLNEAYLKRQLSDCIVTS